VKVRTAGTFITHLLCSTLGVAIAAGFLTFFVYGIIHIWNPLFTSRFASYTLTEVPGFPVQIVVGGLIGYVMGERAPDQSSFYGHGSCCSYVS
jgi:hypothetical protein